MTKKYTQAQEQFLLDCAIVLRASRDSSFDPRVNKSSRNYAFTEAEEMLKAAQEEGLLQDDECDHDLRITETFFAKLEEAI